MASLTEADAAVLAPIIETQCRKVAERYDGVEADDLAQEVWVWALSEGVERIQRYLLADQKAQLTKAAYYEAVKWCERDRKQKLREAGLNWRDEYNYTRPEVARLLPLALDTGSVPGVSGGAMSEAPGAKSDPATGGDLLVGVIDVRTAYGKLSPEDQDFVQVVVGLNTVWDDVAACTGLKTASAYAKYMRILDRMVTRHLGRKTDEDEE